MRVARRRDRRFRSKLHADNKPTSPSTDPKRQVPGKAAAVMPVVKGVTQLGFELETPELEVDTFAARLSRRFA